MRTNQVKSKYKIVFLGDQSVGKTAIINRFINNCFEPTYNATIGIDFLVKNVTYNQKSCRIQLWDTAGQQRFKSLIPSYLKDSSCCLIVYDVTSSQSLVNAFKWLQLYNQHKNVKAVSFLIGNKIDLEDKVNTEESNLEKIKLSKLKHFLVSAKDGNGINETFEKIIELLDNHLYAIMVNSIPSDGQNQKQMTTGKTLLKESSANFHLQQSVYPQKQKNCCI